MNTGVVQSSPVICGRWCGDLAQCHGGQWSRYHEKYV